MHVDLHGLRITWLGHATFRIETPKGATVLIDPWVMGNPACPESEKKINTKPIQQRASRLVRLARSGDLKSSFAMLGR